MSRYHHRISRRIAEVTEQSSEGRCSTPFCGRPTMAAAGKGLAQLHCKRCVQHKARHGSTWAGTLSAKELTPYVRVASEWVTSHKGDNSVAYALLGLRDLLEHSGEVEPARHMKRRAAQDKARVAFARLREAGVDAEKVLAVQIGVTACISDDDYAPRASEYAQVQVGKALHRRASGTLSPWAWDSERSRPIEARHYPRSSGLVLRIIGREVFETCSGVAETGAPAVQAEKLAKFGPHESKLPGYKPPWQLAKEEAERRQREQPNAAR